jgi:nucleoside-diphosphate kinase
MKHLQNYIGESLSINKRVFVVLKPGSLDLGQAVIERFEKDGWKIERTITKKLLLSEARRLYEVHKKEDFYKDLCEYMTSGPSRAFIFYNPNSEKPFKEVKAIKEEIRNKYGESDMRNVLHSSDSIKNMNKEMAVYFA